MHNQEFQSQMEVNFAFTMYMTVTIGVTDKMHIHWLFLHKAQMDAERSGHVLHFVEKKDVEREEYRHPTCLIAQLLSKDA